MVGPRPERLRSRARLRPVADDMYFDRKLLDDQVAVPPTRPHDLVVLLEKSLDQLSPFQQAAVRLIYRDGCSIADAGRMLGVDTPEVQRALGVVFRHVATWVLDGDVPALQITPI